MKTTFDTDTILYRLLKDSPVKNALSGSIYVGDDRPDDSQDEDIVVNSLELTQEHLPQVGTGNVNIFVPDVPVTIAGKPQTKANRIRLKALSELVMQTLRDARIEGLKLIPTGQSTLAEPDVKQHFVNIRVEWNIQS